MVKKYSSATILIIAGDIFDDGWRPTRCPAELINFAIENLPVNYTSLHTYAIPGQHDLPHHRYSDVAKSAYYTLTKAHRERNSARSIDNLGSDGQVTIAEEFLVPNDYNFHGVRLHAFPWGSDVKLPKIPNPLRSHGRGPDSRWLDIAVVHKYLWSGDAKHPGAMNSCNVASTDFSGYDVAIIGDNHTPWENVQGRCAIVNCGTFMRRKMDEIQHTPSAVLIYDNGDVGREYLDVSADKFVSPDEVEMIDAAYDLKEFIATLEGLADTGVNFVDAAFRYMKDRRIDPAVREIVLKSMEKTNG